jgi:hypothetical protein
MRFSPALCGWEFFLEKLEHGSPSDHEDKNSNHFSTVLWENVFESLRYEGTKDPMKAIREASASNPSSRGAESECDTHAEVEAASSGAVSRLSQKDETGDIQPDGRRDTAYDSTEMKEFVDLGRDVAYDSTELNEFVHLSVPESGLERVPSSQYMRDSYMWHSSFAEAKAYVTDLPSTRDAYVYSKEAPMSKTDLPYGSITGRQAFQRKDRYADRTQNGKTLAFKAPAPISIDRVPRLLHVTDEGVISTDYRSQELWAAPKHDAVQVSPVQQLWQAGADVFAGSAEHELSQLRMKNAGKDPERYIERGDRR